MQATNQAVCFPTQFFFMNPNITKQPTNQAVRFPAQLFFMNPTIAKLRLPTQLFFMNWMTAGDKSPEKNPVHTEVAGAVLLTMPQSTINICMQREEVQAKKSANWEKGRVHWCHRWQSGRE